jgi:hypothetical protein
MTNRPLMKCLINRLWNDRRNELLVEFSNGLLYLLLFHIRIAGPFNTIRAYAFPNYLWNDQL